MFSKKIFSGRKKYLGGVTPKFPSVATGAERPRQPGSSPNGSGSTALTTEIAQFNYQGYL